MTLGLVELHHVLVNSIFKSQAFALENFILFFQFVGESSLFFQDGELIFQISENFLVSHFCQVLRNFFFEGGKSNCKLLVLLMKFVIFLQEARLILFQLVQSVFKFVDARFKFFDLFDLDFVLSFILPQHG